MFIWFNRWLTHFPFVAGTSIGKRYARTDEIGVPFAVTVDSVATVTIRERDSKEQIRVAVDEVASVVKEVTEGQSTWADVMWRYPTHAASSDEWWNLASSQFLYWVIYYLLPKEYKYINVTSVTHFQVLAFSLLKLLDLLSNNMQALCLVLKTLTLEKLKYGMDIIADILLVSRQYG